jgi:hypothetical protein
MEACLALARYILSTVFISNTVIFGEPVAPTSIQPFFQNEYFYLGG